MNPFAVLAAALALGSPASAREADARPVVQLALLLDTSGSMEGLLEQAKSKLWTIVNGLATAKRGGQSPRIEVALYEYGKSSIPSAEGFVRRILPLTANLDKVSEELFKLKTDGGDEFCGLAIQKATTDLAWSKDKSSLKLIFIAGNEPFSQGPADYKAAARAAIAKGITVNTIFCGLEGEGARSGWKEGAALADGRFLVIDHNRAVVHLSAPQDAELARLSSELNGTYLAFGASGREEKARQSIVDKLAFAAAPVVAAQRAVAKAGAQYEASEWDVVDAVEGGRLDLAKADPKDLPDELRKLQPQKRKAYVDAKKKEREALQKRIRKLNEEREAHLENTRKSQPKDSLDAAMLEAIREQAVKKGYKF